MPPLIPLRPIHPLREPHHRRRHRQRAPLLRRLPIAVIPLYRVQIAALARALCVLDLVLAAGVPDAEGEGYGEDEDCDAEDDERD